MQRLIGKFKIEREDAWKFAERDYQEWKRLVSEVMHFLLCCP